MQIVWFWGGWTNWIQCLICFLKNELIFETNELIFETNDLFFCRNNSI